METSLYVRLSFLQFLQFFIWGSWFVTAGTYLLETLQFSGREVGMVYGTTAIAATLSPFLLGLLADRYFSSEKLLSVLHFLGGGLLFYLSKVDHFSLFYPVMLLYVLCFLPTFSLAHGLCLHHITDTNKDFPKVRVWGTISWILAGLLISWLKVEKEVLPLEIAAGFSILQGVYCLTLPKTPPSPQEGKNFFQSLFDPEIRALFKDRSFVVMIVALTLICIPSSYYYSFVNPFLNEMGVTNAAGKMAIGQVTEIVLMLALPFFLLRFSFRNILFIGLLSWGIRYGVFIIGIEWNSELLYMIGIALHGVAFVFAMFSAQIYMDKKVPTHLRNTAQGFYTLLTLGFGVFIGSYIAGETVSIYTFDSNLHDWAAIWLLPAVIGVVVALGFWRLFGSGKMEA